MSKILKPIYQMTWEEFERTLPETLTTEEENTIVDEIFKVEAPKYIEKFKEVTGVTYGIEELEDICSEIVSYGGKEWAETTIKSLEEVYWIKPIGEEW